MREGGRCCVYTLSFVKRSRYFFWKCTLVLLGMNALFNAKGKEREGASHSFVKKVEWK